MQNRQRRWTYLRHARLRKGLKIPELAEAIGYSRVFIAQVEAGKYGPSDRLLYLLANALDVDVVELDRTKPQVPPRTAPRATRTSPPDRDAA